MSSGLRLGILAGLDVLEVEASSAYHLRSKSHQSPYFLVVTVGVRPGIDFEHDPAGAFRAVTVQVRSAIDSAA